MLFACAITPCECRRILVTRLRIVPVVGGEADKGSNGFEWLNHVGIMECCWLQRCYSPLIRWLAPSSISGWHRLTDSRRAFFGSKKDRSACNQFFHCTDSQDFDISTTYSKVVKSRPIFDMLAIDSGQQNCVVYRTMVGDLFCSRVK